MEGKGGFTLIEIMIVLALIGIIAALGLPRVFRSPVPITQQFIGKLNSLITQAVEQTEQSGEPRRLFFNLTSRIVEIQTIEGKSAGGKLEIPSVIEVGDVVINGVSQFAIGSTTKSTFYFLINAEGISQEVQLLLNERISSEKVRTTDFLLNPFSAFFRVT